MQRKVDVGSLTAEEGLPETVNGKFYKHFPYNDRMDRRVWEWALALTTWKSLHGYKLR